MIEAVLIGLLKANLAAGAAILAVLAIRQLVRPRFGARSAYALWLAPLAAALAVLAPHPAAPRLAAPLASAAAFAADVFVATAPAGASAPNTGAIALGVWLAGVLAAGAILLRRQARFTAAMGRLSPSAEPGVYRAETAAVGPAVVGALRPRIVAPADFETRFAPDERALILAHERSHLASGDAAINGLACAAQCLCWFNPLVHLGVSALRIDQELACDASVIGAFPEARKPYAELLLKTQLVAQPLPLGCFWPPGADHPLKERIAMLKSPPPEAAMRAMGVLVAGCLVAGAGGMAWASQPPGAAPDPTGPGAAERAEAQARNAAHPSYSCDRALELSGGGCKIVNAPTWLALPTHADLMAQYPPAALKTGVTAEVALHCGMTGDGLLTDCVAGETDLKAPGGAAVGDGVRAQFGAAAVAVSRYYQFAIPAGMPTKGLGRSRANLRVIFDPDTVGGGFPPGPPGSVPARPTPASAGPDVLRVSRSTVTPGPSSPEIQRVAQVTQGKATPEAGLAAYLQSPNWTRRPGVEDLMKVYPPEAVRSRIEGDVLLHCHVLATGKLSDCGVLRETPQGAGFGAAALELTDLFEAREQVPDGGPKRGTDIRIPIRFRMPSPPAAPGN